MVTVLYDADCGFCTRCAQVLARWGATATVSPLQTADLTTLGVDASRALRELPTVLDDGAVVYGAEAFRVALTTGPWWMRTFARLLRLWPLSVLARWTYAVVAANRYRLPGATAACAVRRPDQPQSGLG